MKQEIKIRREWLERLSEISEDILPKAQEKLRISNDSLTSSEVAYLRGYLSGIKDILEKSK